MKKINLNKYLLAKYGERGMNTITNKFAIQKAKYVEQVKK
jgi:hypothetical protein